MLTGVIAAGVVAVGRLNLIAPLVSMFFLISYGLLNYATFYEARLASPSFRPRFRFYDQRLSLAGALLCLGSMLALDLYAGLVALALLLAIHQYLLRTAGPASWADSRRSYHLQQVRTHLLAAARETEHSRHWRPHILAFSDDPERRRPLLTFADWISGNSGMTTLVRIVEDQGVKGFVTRQAAYHELVEAIQKSGVPAFPLTVTAESLQQGVASVLQSYGVGPLQGNTVLLNWILQGGRNQNKFFESASNLRTVFRLGYNIVMLDAREGKWLDSSKEDSSERRIDIWWWGGATSRFMLLLAYLMTRHEDWSQARLRVLAVADQEGSLQAEQNLQETLDSYRIEAESRIVSRPQASSIVEQSKDAGLVFIPFTFRGDELLGPFGGELDWLLVRLPLTAMALAAEDIDLDAQPEEGAVAEQAEAVHALEQARKRRRLAEEEAHTASEEATRQRRLLEEAMAKDRDRQELTGLEDAVSQAEATADQAARKLAKAKAREQQAESELRKINAALIDDSDESGSEDV